ncbi:hypothetical protein P1J78_07810 [Psychromarinibacter sp. C21-152]|uniref:Type I phosphodiesterase / nucleotide pyrophosphatase n=1 Tax=Psychromarinibacter sediminicola TaxID=3033385 RepID=A0AAE3NRE9_9RHOB|nr:hypothetical protein [Psychromarinibacter sediminicola]MDF0600631.1 hypothetical protein [Psychromarinibacter sediminicola]
MSPKGPQPPLRRRLRLVARSLAAVGGWLARPVPARAPAPLDRPADTVILVTLDGVRPQELLRTGADGPLMPFLMRELLPRGTFLGSDTDPPAFRTGSPVGISMSGYHSIFKGRLTLCIENTDPPPRGETLVTRVQGAFPGDPVPVKLFATWPRLLDGLKADPARAVSVRGRKVATEEAAARGLDLGTDPAADEPAFRLALAELRAGAPRLHYLGLNQSDSAAHGANWPVLKEVLARYDGYLRALVAEMEALQARGRAVTLIVTTDHGRGDGDEWPEHLWKYKGTDRAWFFAMGHGIAARGHATDGPPRTHFDIRPTIEYLLGLPPRRRWWLGAVMKELLAHGTDAAQAPDARRDRTDRAAE